MTRRIRTLKPEFFESETVARLGFFARLLFVGLITLADDAGRLRGASRLIASQAFPYDQAIEMVEAALEELAAQKLIRRYQVSGSSYILISGWLEHQKIDKPSKSKLPAPEDAISALLPAENVPQHREASPNIREASTSIREVSETPLEASGNHRETSTTDLDLDLDLDRDRVVAQSAPPAPRAKVARRLPNDWTLSEDDRRFAEDLGLDPDGVAAGFRDYWLAAGGTNARKLDWSATWRIWCRRECERRPSPRTAPAKPAGHLEKSAEVARNNAAHMRDLQRKLMGPPDDFEGLTIDQEFSHVQ